MAITLCLEVIAQQDEDALVAFFPSDHHYSNCAAFRETVDSGLCLMSEYPQSILIVGVEARYPEVEYGWIEPGRMPVDSLVNPLLRVSRFWEKPTVKDAEELHRQECLWNTFVTIGFAGTFLELLQATVPRLTRLLGSNPYVDRLYHEVPAVDFSKAVADEDT